jgi:hypothetical protein
MLVFYALSHVCMYVCLYCCMHMYVHVPIYVCMYTCTYGWLVGTSNEIKISNVRSRYYMHACIHTYTITCLDKPIHKYIHRLIQTYTYTHTYTHIPRRCLQRCWSATLAQKFAQFRRCAPVCLNVCVPLLPAKWKVTCVCVFAQTRTKRMVCVRLYALMCVYSCSLQNER